MAKKNAERPVESQAPAEEVNKSQAIKDFLATEPDASPKLIVETMTRQGIDVSANYASNVKSTSKNKAASKSQARAKAKRKAKAKTETKIEAQTEPAPKTRKKVVRRKKRRAAKPALEAAAAPAPADDLVALSALLEAKRLVAKLGDLKLAKQAIEALAKLTQ